MHFHHKHDIDGCTHDHTGEWPDWALAILATIDRRELILMTAVQDSINAAATVIGELSDRIKVLEAASQPPADTAALDAAVAAAKAELPAPAPVDGSPAEESAETPAQAASEPDAAPVPVVEPVPAPMVPVDVPDPASPPPSVPLA